jgi:hypothetical protein
MDTDAVKTSYGSKNRKDSSCQVAAFNPHLYIWMLLRSIPSIEIIQLFNINGVQMSREVKNINDHA